MLSPNQRYSRDSIFCFSHRCGDSRFSVGVTAGIFVILIILVLTPLLIRLLIKLWPSTSIGQKILNIPQSGRDRKKNPPNFETAQPLQILINKGFRSRICNPMGLQILVMEESRSLLKANSSRAAERYESSKIAWEGSTSLPQFPSLNALQLSISSQGIPRDGISPLSTCTFKLFHALD